MIKALVIFKEHLVLTKQAMIWINVLVDPKRSRYYCDTVTGDATSLFDVLLDSLEFSNSKLERDHAEDGQY